MRIQNDRRSRPPSPRTQWWFCALTPAAIAVTLWGTGLAAQGAPSVGAAVGLARMPAVFQPGCNDSRLGQVGGASAELRGAVPIAATLAVEARAGGYSPWPGPKCVVGEPYYHATPWVRQEFQSATDGSFTSDLRLRWQPDTRVVLTAGGGWMWALHSPYVAVGPGFRTPGRVRLMVDVDWLLARLPYDVVTSDWQMSQVAWQEVARVHAHDWRSLASLRLGVEVGLR